MAYNKLTCQKCGRPFSLAGNEIALAIPYFDQTDTLRWGIFCSNEYCSKLPSDTKILDLQNNRFNVRVLYKQQRQLIDSFKKREW